MNNRHHSARNTVNRLRDRARHLRRESSDQLAPLAMAYRRRAAELELQAEVLDEKLVKFAPTDEPTTALAA